MSTMLEPSDTSGLRRRVRLPLVTQLTEEVLVEKLDKFLSSIELRLELFEQYFKFNEEDSKSRRNSCTSLSSLKTFSEMNLSRIHEQLHVVKQLVLKTSFTNLEYLYKTLDDQYNSLFNPDSETDADTSFDNGKEVLSRKIIDTIHYFDVKLNQVDNLIQEKTPQAKEDYSKDSKFRPFAFYNFNTALKNAETKYLHYYELPLSWRENRYIIQGYRFSLKHTEMLKSIFHFNHNETMNIWTHLLGAGFIGWLMLVHFPTTSVYQQATAKQTWAMYVFLLAGIKCLVSSVVWHTYLCFAKLPFRQLCACVDYTGITVLITALVVSAEFCALYHYPKILSVYIGFSLLCGATSFAFNWLSYFDRPECRLLRIGFFMGLAFMGITAMICYSWYEGVMAALVFFSPLVYQSFVWYWIGVVFYGGLIPERWRYDIIINEDDTCDHNHTTTEVLEGKVEHSGQEELDEIEHEIEDQHETTDDILRKHFPLEPTKTPYHRDFFSLWWVDYAFSSHNFWHMCVVMGVVGHYFSLLEMYTNVLA